MTTFVVDASVAIKWVVEEPGTAAALSIRAAERLVAPDLWVAECANILWKKVRRGEFSADQALAAAELLEAAGVEVMAGEPAMSHVVRLATTLDHPAYDCVISPWRRPMAGRWSPSTTACSNGFAARASNDMLGRSTRRRPRPTQPAPRRPPAAGSITLDAAREIRQSSRP